MKNEKIETSVELYICNHERIDKENCASKGAKVLTDELKKWTKENYKGQIKVVRSGCLGRCSEGIAMACYPQKNFIVETKAEDITGIQKGLLEALNKARD